MDKTAKIVSNYIRDNQLIDNSQELIVAVSGGIDSVVLLDILIKSGYKCIIAHCNFHLRGEESNKDEDFVKNIAERYNIKIFSKSFATTEYARQQGISIEMAARELRYEWFEELLNTTQAKAVAVAHHKNDNAETLLLNLARGTGFKGLIGMRAQRNSIIRPLLSISKKEVEKYAEDNNISYCIDVTNSDTQFHRNRIRHNIIPELEKINPKFIDTTGNFLNIMSEYDSLFDKTISKYIDKISSTSKGVLSVDIPALTKTNFPKLLLFEITQNLNIPASTFEEIYKLLYSQTGKYINSKNYYIVKDRNKIIFHSDIHTDKKKYKILATTQKIDVPLSLTFDITSVDNLYSFKSDNNIALLDYDKIKYPLMLRVWRHGDKFKPLGMNGFKKVSDFLTDNKIDIISKQNKWLLESDKKIMWVIDHRIDDRFKITDKTKRILKVKYNKNKE